MKETYLFEIVLVKGKFELEDGKIVETPFNIKGLMGLTIDQAKDVVAKHNQTLRVSQIESTE